MARFSTRPALLGSAVALTAGATLSSQLAEKRRRREDAKRRQNLKSVS